ncbi:Golgi apparatus membrane protein TVP23 [Dirofilaria immitis]|nr:Golgi apparatus membrane protein TVP23 [Dirofilaria immitis]
MVGINSDDESDVEIPMDIEPTVSKKKKVKTFIKKEKEERNDTGDPLLHHHLLHRPTHQAIAPRVQAKISIMRDFQSRKYCVPLKRAFAKYDYIRHGHVHIFKNLLKPVKLPCFQHTSIEIELMFLDRYVVPANHRWSFMTEFNPSNAKSFMVMDLKGDRSNVQYDSLYKNDVAQYEFLLKKFLVVMKPLKNLERRARTIMEEKELKPFTDYIELSRFALSENDLRDESGNLSLEKCDVVQGGRSLIEATPETKSRRYNAELGKDRYNIELWLKFLAVQAISLNFNCVKLKIERLKIGMHLWEEDVFIREIRNVEFKHVNDPEMWEGVLDLLESDTRRFNLANQCMKMKVCLEKLEEVRSGKLLSHKALPNTEQFMASVVLRKIRLLLKCGYTEKAIATAQAICEFNLCIPESFKTADLEDKRRLFEAFWDSGIARIGDEGAEEAELCNRIGPNGLKLPYRLVWIEIERLRTQYQWRPIRDLGATFDDRERVVTFQDIEDVLYIFNSSVTFNLFCSILEEFGAVIYGRILELASSYIQEERDLLLSSQLLTYLNFLKMDGELNEKMRLKKFREEAKNICRKNNNVNNISLMATFAEKLYELGEKNASKVCANKFLMKNMWNETETARTISLLRMALICISATDDETEKRHLIASFICEGRPVTDVTTDAKEIEKQVNIHLHDLLTNKCVKETWEGSKKYLELLQMHIKSNPCEPQRLLMEASLMAYQKFPTEISFLKIYIDGCAVGTRIIHLRRFLENDVKDWHANYCLAFGSVYLELFRHRRLLEASDFQSPELHRLRAAVKKSSERIYHRDDVFGAYYCSSRMNEKMLVVFYLAYTECPWSKSLIMDYKDVNAGEHEKLLDALLADYPMLVSQDDIMAANFDSKLNISQGQFVRSATQGTFRHPPIVFSHVIFRSAAIFFYVFAYLFTDSFIIHFLIILTLLSIDFWTVKNITGRLLVGLRWWNFVDAEGKNHWRYESAKDMSRFDILERRIFGVL